MRAFLVVAFGLATTTPAVACPRGAACIAASAHAAESVTTETPRVRVTTLQLAITSAALARDPRDESLRTHVVPRPRPVAMPWIWQVLRREVYQRMPHYEERQFTLTLSPVVVEGTFDTVPGIGVAGDF